MFKAVDEPKMYKDVICDITKGRTKQQSLYTIKLVEIWPVLL